MKRNISILLLAVFCAVETLCAQTVTKKSTGEDALTVMTYNIRYRNDYDRAENQWDTQRRPLVAAMIRLFRPEVLGLQEVLEPQLKDLRGDLGVSFYGIGREDGKAKGEHSALAFEGEHKLLRWGTFWFSETPHKPSKGWDAACERIATWAVVKFPASHSPVFVMNLHLDHEGKVARQKSAEMILAAVDSLAKGLPAMVMGDFNATPDDPVLKILTDERNPRHLTDSRALAQTVLGPSWSYQEFGNLPMDKRVLIDYVLLKGPWQMHEYGVMDVGRPDGGYASDHCPVVIRLSLKK